MNIRKLAGSLTVLIALGLIVFGLTSALWPQSSPATSTYSNARLGITFAYPDSYALQEREVGNAERGHYEIFLIDKRALANIPEAGEGPPAVTIEAYQNNIDKLSVEKWIRNTSASNFKLSSDGKLTPISTAGVKGFYYRWDGLYRGESTVIAHKGNILVFSATYLQETDQIRADYGQILNLVVLN